MSNDEFEALVADLQRARGVIRNLLAVLDSDAMSREHAIAYVHGVVCDEETSTRHGRYIAEAREFLKPV